MPIGYETKAPCLLPALVPVRQLGIPPPTKTMLPYNPLVDGHGGSVHLIAGGGGGANGNNQQYQQSQRQHPHNPAYPTMPMTYRETSTIISRRLFLFLLLPTKTLKRVPHKSQRRQLLLLLLLLLPPRNAAVTTRPRAASVQGRHAMGKRNKVDKDCNNKGKEDLICFNDNVAKNKEQDHHNPTSVTIPTTRPNQTEKKVRDSSLAANESPATPPPAIPPVLPLQTTTNLNDGVTPQPQPPPPSTESASVTAAVAVPVLTNDRLRERKEAQEQQQKRQQKVGKKGFFCCM